MVLSEILFYKTMHKFCFLKSEIFRVLILKGIINYASQSFFKVDTQTCIKNNIKIVQIKRFLMLITSFLSTDVNEHFISINHIFFTLLFYIYIYAMPEYPLDGGGASLI
jgi:hypothetical protein